LLHYLGKLKIKIFCRYSTDMAQMQTYCILIAINLVAPTTFDIFGLYNSKSFFILISNKSFIKILSASFRTMLTFDRHGSDVRCDEFPVPQIGDKSRPK